MTPLTIPRTLPAHARTWLAFLDAELTERAMHRYGTDAIEARAREARRQLAPERATGNTAYFLGLYVEVLEERA